MLELLKRAYLGYWDWIDYGGWHRVVALIVFCMGIICLVYIWEKIKKWLTR